MVSKYTVDQKTDFSAEVWLLLTADAILVCNACRSLSCCAVLHVF